MINLQPASNQATVCHPPPHVHDHPFLSGHMYTGGGSFLLQTMPWLGGPVLTWQSLSSPLAYRQSMVKYVVTACGAYLQSRIALHSSRHIGTADAYRKVHYQALRSAI